MCMLKILLVVSSVMMLYPSGKIPFENKTGLNYYAGTYNEALEEAKLKNKLVFLDAYTDWCGWCRKLDKTTFSNASVISYLNDNFVIMKVNIEKGDGPALRSKYSVNSYPTLLFINSKGKEVHRISGYVDATDFLVEAEQAVLKK